MLRPRGYGQFCPVAKAAEVFAERWTPIVLRELLYGNRRFQELRRGIPLITPTMLSQRLRELIDAGLVLRHDRSGKAEYHLTPAGEEMRPIIEQLGAWGQRWIHHRITEDDLDPAFLMWAIHRHLNVHELPNRAVLLFEFPERRPSERRWWLIVENGEVDLCLKNPGHEVDITVTSDVRTMTMVYLGRVDATAAVRSSSITLSGSKALTRSFAKWCARSRFADVQPGQRLHEG